MSSVTDKSRGHGSVFCLQVHVKNWPLWARVWASQSHGLTMWTGHSICLQTRGLVGRQGGPVMCLRELPKDVLPESPQCTPGRDAQSLPHSTGSRWFARRWLDVRPSH